LFPDKFVVVMRVLDSKVSVSARGKNIRGKVLKAIKDLKDATGGGHEDAVGAKVRTEDLEEFKERLRHVVEDRKI
jgi:oligoribonuclease NrnB/cAMP/cGMP phosphodiesterase (DHH superfamily)